MIAGGFALVVLLSVVPWSRFGDASHSLGAWSMHWSLLAVGGAAAGLVAEILAWRRPVAPVLASIASGALALTVVLGAILHYERPPPLSVGSPAPWIAVGAGVVALAGAVRKLRAHLPREHP